MNSVTLNDGIKNSSAGWIYEMHYTNIWHWQCKTLFYRETNRSVFDVTFFP